MPAYSFSLDEFVPMILKKRKPHTIRRRRKNPTKPDDVLSLYYKQRTRNCRAISLTQCTKVTPLIIYPDQGLIKLNGLLLTDKRIRKLTWRDGFDNPDIFFDFFKRYQKPVLDDLDLIEWNTEKFIPLWDVDLFQKLIKGMSTSERLGWLDASYELGKNMLSQQEWQKAYLNEWSQEAIHE